MITCKYGHLHRDATGARICEAAWRHTLAKRLQTSQLLTDLRAALARAAVRNAKRGI